MGRDDSPLERSSFEDMLDEMADEVLEHLDDDGA